MNEKKWNMIKEVLCEGLDTKQARMMKLFAENARKEAARFAKIGTPQPAMGLFENASAGATAISNIGTLDKVILPVIRRVLPTTFTQELVGVQPLEAPTGKIIAMRMAYANSVPGANVVAGEEAMAPLHIRRLAASFSGNEVESDPAGGDIAKMEAVRGNGYKMHFLQKEVTAKERRLFSNWTVEAAHAAQSLYGVDIESETIAMLAQAIAVETDQEIIRTMRKVAGTPTAANTYDQAITTGQPITVVDQHAVLATLMHRAATIIASRTRMGRGNWAVVSNVAQSILESATASTFARTTEGKLEAPSNNQFVGVLNNSMKVYVDTYAPDNAPVLVGYKGKQESEAGFIYSPYVPISMSPVMYHPDNPLQPQVVVYSLYAFTVFDNLSDSFAQSRDFVQPVGINAATLSFI